LNWLRKASDQGDPDATFNLALLFGSGLILNSYRLCDITQSPARADQYLREADARGQPVAKRLRQRYGGEPSPELRLHHIMAEQLAGGKSGDDGVFDRLELIGPRCAQERLNQ